MGIQTFPKVIFLISLCPLLLHLNEKIRIVWKKRLLGRRASVMQWLYMFYMLTIRVNKWKDVCNLMLSVIQTFSLRWWGWIFSAISLIPTLCNASRLGELESYPGDNLLLLKFIHLSYIFIFACFIKLWNGTMIYSSFTSIISRQHQHKKKNEPNILRKPPPEADIGFYLAQKANN